VTAVPEHADTGPDAGPGVVGPGVVGPPGADEVDRIVAAWRRERPDLDVAPLEVLSRVSRLSRHLDRDRAAAFSRHGLEPWEFDVLAALRRSGPPYQLSPGALIAETLVTSGTMTNRIDRLEGRGLVLRLRDPDDGRGVLVRLTAPGRGLVDTALAALLEREHALLADLTAKERTALAGLLRHLVTPFEPPVIKQNRRDQAEQA
jgi:DNA-binding MarR family transcriptional regulator